MQLRRQRSTSVRVVAACLALLSAFMAAACKKTDTTQGQTGSTFGGPTNPSVKGDGGGAGY